MSITSLEFNYKIIAFLFKRSQPLSHCLIETTTRNTFRLWDIISAFVGNDSIYIFCSTFFVDVIVSSSANRTELNALIFVISWTNFIFVMHVKCGIIIRWHFLPISFSLSAPAISHISLRMFELNWCGLDENINLIMNNGNTRWRCLQHMRIGSSVFVRRT